MPNTLLYYPMIGMFLLTAYIGIRLAILRFKAVRVGDLDGRYYRLNRGAEKPEYLAKMSNNFDNLMATPVLFYLVCMMIINNHYVTMTNLVIAYLYVGSRALHSYIHTGRNRVMPRMRVFFVSLLLLLALWGDFAWQLSGY